MLLLEVFLGYLTVFDQVESIKRGSRNVYPLRTAQTAFSGYDADKDPRYSAAKTGGYQWADGWIDPSYRLAGPKDHPTLSVQDSNRKQLDFQSAALRWKNREKKRMQEEDDLFDV